MTLTERTQLRNAIIAKHYAKLSSYIINYVETFYGATPGEWRKTDRSPVHSKPRISAMRQCICHLLRKYTRLGVKQIGQIIGIDHSSVVYHTNKNVCFLTNPETFKHPHLTPFALTLKFLDLQIHLNFNLLEISQACKDEIDAAGEIERRYPAPDWRLAVALSETHRKELADDVKKTRILITKHEEFANHD